MSYKQGSMPSINESDNEEEILSNNEETSTSDYSSLNHKKNATLTKAVDELVELMDLSFDKGSTLKQINNTQQISDDNFSNNSTEISQYSHESSKKENTDCHIDYGANYTDSNCTNDSSKEQNGQMEIPQIYEYSETDRFGFMRGNHYTDHNSDLNIPITINRSREKKWQDMVLKWEEYKTKKYKKIVSRCRKGIPQSLRCKVWQLLCKSRGLETTLQERTFYKDQLKVPKKKEFNRISFRNSTQAVNSSDNDSISVSSFYSTVSPSRKSDYFNSALKSQHHELYETYKACTPNPDVVEQIRKDIHRQFPNHINFKDKGGFGQESLSTILTVYSIRHPETGYCQGMAPLAAALLMVMPEEDAFWTFDKICDSYIPGYYDVGLKQIQTDAKALMELLKKESSSVHNCLDKNQIDPICYMIDWFMCIYIRTLPWPSVLQVMDMFLCEGKSVLFKVALVLIIGSINKYKQTLKEGQEMEILFILRHLPDDITTPKYLTSQIAKLTVTKTDIKKECLHQEAQMAKARLKSMAMHK